MKRIGFIGLGAMGLPMAANLLKRGYRLTVYDVVRERMRTLTEKGALAAASPKDAAFGNEIVMTMLPSSPGRGAGRARPGRGPGRDRGGDDLCGLEQYRSGDDKEDRSGSLREKGEDARCPRDQRCPRRHRRDTDHACRWGRGGARASPGCPSDHGQDDSPHGGERGGLHHEAGEQHDPSGDRGRHRRSRGVRRQGRSEPGQDDGRHRRGKRFEQGIEDPHPGGAR